MLLAGCDPLRLVQDANESPGAPGARARGNRPLAASFFWDPPQSGGFLHLFPLKPPKRGLPSTKCSLVFSGNISSLETAGELVMLAKRQTCGLLSIDQGHLFSQKGHLCFCAYGVSQLVVSQQRCGFLRIASQQRKKTEHHVGFGSKKINHQESDRRFESVLAVCHGLILDFGLPGFDRSAPSSRSFRESWQEQRHFLRRIEMRRTPDPTPRMQNQIRVFQRMLAALPQKAHDTVMLFFGHGNGAYGNHAFATAEAVNAWLQAGARMGFCQSFHFAVPSVDNFHTSRVTDFFLQPLRQCADLLSGRKEERPCGEKRGGC